MAGGAHAGPLQDFPIGVHDEDRAPVQLAKGGLYRRSISSDEPEHVLGINVRRGRTGEVGRCQLIHSLCERIEVVPIEPVEDRFGDRVRHPGVGFPLAGQS